jgi:membrane-bound lytic murein transglycosylase F
MGLEPTPPGTTIQCSNQLSYIHRVKSDGKYINYFSYIANTKRLLIIMKPKKNFLQTCFTTNFKLNILQIFSITILIILTSCNSESEKEKINKNSLDSIKKRGKIIAVTDNNSTSYFVYRGSPLGYQYELLKEYADYMNLGLEIVINNNLQDKFKMLRKGDVDIIAVNLTVTKIRERQMDFTDPLGETRQVLVQRKQTNKDSLVKKIEQLHAKTVYVQKNSVFAANLKSIARDNKILINVVETDQYGVEELVLKVSEGDIDYTVCDEDVALLNKTWLNNIDVETALSDNEPLAWAVKRKNDSLRISINQWLDEFKETKRFTGIYYRYFQNPKHGRIITSQYHSLAGGNISKYDDIIKELSSDTYWDWRLISSLIYHESNFDHSVRSWAGAAGLMQLMPQTAKAYGVSIDAGPTANIAAGIRVINSIDKMFAEEITDSLERIKFILASYNIGPGHVLDAMRLAEKYGKDPNIWFNNVDTFLLLKSNPQYYRDSVVKHGYCRGTETISFVKKVLDVYYHYTNLIEH